MDKHEIMRYINSGQTKMPDFLEQIINSHITICSCAVVIGVIGSWVSFALVYGSLKKYGWNKNTFLKIWPFILSTVTVGYMTFIYIASLINVYFFPKAYIIKNLL